MKGIINICHRCKKHSMCIPARYNGDLYPFMTKTNKIDGIIYVENCARYQSNTIGGKNKR